MRSPVSHPLGTRLVAAVLLLAAPFARAAAGSPVFNVLDFGAKNDGSASSTDAFRAAIQAAKGAGGGTVFVPPGNYVTGPIDLVSNLVLDIEAGATLQFPATRLPLAKGRVQGIECLQPVPLIGGMNVENVTITGRGVVTTNNADWTKLMGRPQGVAGGAFGPVWEALRTGLEKKTPASDEEYVKAAPYLRPAFIRFMESKNVLVEGIHMVGSSFWSIHLLYSTNAIVRGVTLETYPGAFTGGIYVDSSRDIRIADCYVDTGDDAIVLKSGKDADGLRVNRPTENVVITNCVVHHGSGGVVLGSEMSGGIRNVVATNIVCQGTQMGINIKSDRGRGGVVENIRMDNWTMDDVGRAINVSDYYVHEGNVTATPPKASDRTPVIRNISISNINIIRCRAAVGYEPAPPVMINIEGLPEMPISGLRISHVVAAGKAGLKVHDTLALQLHDVEVNADGAPIFLIRDSRDLELDAVSTRQPLAGVPVVRLDRSPGAVVRASRAYAGTGTFLSTLPGELKTILLVGNALEAAQRPTEESAGPDVEQTQPVR